MQYIDTLHTYRKCLTTNYNKFLSNRLSTFYLFLKLKVPVCVHILSKYCNLILCNIYLQTLWKGHDLLFINTLSNILHIYLKILAYAFPTNFLNFVYFVYSTLLYSTRVKDSKHHKNDLYFITDTETKCFFL